MSQHETVYDLAIIGGGINGAGIARDAAGRGLKVLLVEKNDIASATSSSSSKLVHGGLRYLEHREFKLVKESLAERERLLAIAPHIIRPMTFILPHAPSMRPAWMIALGLKLYDFLAPNTRMGKSRRFALQQEAGFAESLKPGFTTAFSYADCQVDDARLVLLNAMDAAERGATILTRTSCEGLTRSNRDWTLTLKPEGNEAFSAHAYCIINATGPWVNEQAFKAHIHHEGRAKLVKGSHIVVPKIYSGNHACLLQMKDQRIIFLIPFEQDFTLIGTTDVAFHDDPAKVAISPEETHYLIGGANQYLARPISAEDIKWSYAGVRALYDDQSHNISKMTRDYVLELEKDGAPFLTVFGGKITTYRKLAEQVMEKLAPLFPAMKSAAWTHTQPLPGGEISLPKLSAEAANRYPWMPPEVLARWLRQYGARIHAILSHMTNVQELGHEIAGGVFECELAYAQEHEWVKTGDDFLWRRTKLGLHLNSMEQQAVQNWFARN